jgi:mannosyltransferase
LIRELPPAGIMLKRFFDRDSTWHIPLLAGAVFLLNLLFKGFYLDSQPIAGDEPFSIYMAGMSPRDIVTHLMTGNNPPLWELLLHYWTRLFGIGPIAVRFLPLVFSALTAVAIFRLGSTFWHWHVGLLAALLFTFSDYHVHFAHEARGYALFALLTTVSMWCFLAQMRSTTRPWPLIFLLAVVNMMLIYTHFFGLWVLFVQVILILWMLSNAHYRPRGTDGALSIGMALLGYLPYVPVFLHRFRESATQGTWVLPPNGVDGLYTMLWNFSNQPVVTVVCIILLVAGLVHMGLKRGVERPLADKVVLIWFLVPFLLMFGLSYIVPMWLDRYLVFVTPAYYLTLAVLADRLFPSPKGFAVAATVLVLLFAATVHPDVSNRRDLRGAVMRVMELRKELPNAPIYICPEWSDLHFLYHWDKACFRQPPDGMDGTAHARTCLNDVGVFPVRHASQLEIAGVEHVIYLDAAADFSHPDNGILEHLQASYAHCERFHYPAIFNVYHCSGTPTTALE